METFRSLKHSNFRLFFFGQLISLPGLWIQNIAMGWLVYRLTNSAFLLGVVGFASQIPAFVVTPIAGVYADKLNRRKVLMVTQSVSMIVALTLAALILTDKITIVYIVIGAVINGTSFAIDNPFRHAFLVNMIDDRKDLPNAIALNSSMYNSARFIGPPLGGLLVAAAGEGICFLVNGLSYIAVLGSLAAMKVAPFIKNEAESSVLHNLVEGFKYAYKTEHLRILISIVIIISLVGLPFQVFMPVFAKNILAGNSQTLGFLTGALGAGALTGALTLANQPSIKRFPDIMLISGLLFSIGLGTFALSNHIALSLISLFVTGSGMVVLFAACNSLLQTMIHEQMRGRIVSLYTMSFMGFTPIGSFIIGSVSNLGGIQTTLTITATLCLFAIIWYSRKRSSINQALDKYI